MVRKRRTEKPDHWKKKRSPRNAKMRPNGDRRITTNARIDDIIVLFLSTVKISNGDDLTDAELRALEKATFKLVNEMSPYSRFKKNDVTPDVVIPLLTKSEDPISLPDAVRMVKDYGRQWHKVISAADGAGN